MAEINSVLAAHGVNVEAQLLGTRGELGYALTDIGIDYPDEVVGELRVVAVKKDTATCVMTQSTVEIERNDLPSAVGITLSSAS